MKLRKSLLIVFIATVFIDSCTSDTSETKTNSASEGVVEADGFNLKYKRRGSGEPVFVIGSVDYYSKAYSPELEKEIELIFIDSRHFVPDCKLSDDALQKISLPTFSSEIEAIRKHLNLDKISIIGHSVHAQIAIDYAANYPDRVNKMILICGVPYNFSEVSPIKDSLWAADADSLRKAVNESNMALLKNVIDTTSADRQFAVSYFYQSAYNWANPAYDASRLLNGLRTCPQVIGKLFSILPSRKEIIEKLKKVKSPALIIHGKLDFTVPWVSWKGLIEVNTGFKQVLMDNAGHNPQTEESSAGELNRHLLDWMKAKNR